MAETDLLPSQGVAYRSSKYPGFQTPGGAYSTGGASPVSSTTPMAAGSGGGQIDIPQPASGGDMVKDAAGAAGIYGATKFGEGAGAAVGGGASIGEAASAGLNNVKTSVANLFDFSGNAAAQTLSGTAGNVAGQGLSSLGGDVMGNAAQEAFGQMGAQVAGSTAGAAGGAAGSSLASSSFGSRLTSGANMGGAAGAGLGTFAVGLLTGQKPVQAAKSGLLSAAGFAVGNAILPGVGGFIGSTLASFFCLGPGTPVLLADGQNTKLVEDLRIGDELWLGGKVLGRGEVLVGQLYLYKNTTVGEGHAIYEPASGWLRVEDSEFATAIDMSGGAGLVYPILCENHLVCTPWFMASDIDEVDDKGDMTEAERLAHLNSNPAAFAAAYQSWQRHAAVANVAHA